MRTWLLPLGLALALAGRPVAAAPSPERLLDARATTLEQLAEAAGGRGEIALTGVTFGDRAVELRLRQLELLGPGFRLLVNGVERNAAEVAGRFVVVAGNVAEMPGSLAVLVLDRKALAVSGSVSAGRERWQVGVAADHDARPLAARWRAQRVPDGPPETLANDSLFFDRAGAPAKAKPPAVIRAPGGEYEASLVVDSDHEFFLSQGSEEQALSFVLAVMGATSELYRQQIGVSIALQEVNLHTTPDDGWEAPNEYTCEGGSPVLREFGFWYIAHRPVKRFPRAAAIMFTGKAGGDCGGQAVIASLCSVTLGDLAYGMVVVPARDTAAARQSTTAHELGHILGSVHTHCFVPPVDICSSLEAANGCYDGPVEAPAGGGSLMSYCNPRAFSLGEAGRYGFESERVPQTIRAFVEGASGACLLRTNDPFALRAEAEGRTVTLAWLDLFAGEKGWQVEQRQANGKFKRVRALPADTTGIALAGQKAGTLAYRVRATIGRSVSEYSAVVEIVVP